MTVDVATPLVNADWHDAEYRSYREPWPLPVEHVPLTSAIGRVLAADVTAATPLPSFTASAMDGWVVSGAGPWRIVGSAANTDRPDIPPLDAGTAVRVHTGAAVPPGADAVVRRERGCESGGVLSAANPHIPRSTDIRYQGEELDRGAILARSGTTVTPPLAGLAAAAGRDELPVRRRPRVRLLVLGDELLTHGPARHGLVRDALAVQLPGWVEWLGGLVDAQRFVPDRLDQTSAAIADADADVVVTTGGSSVGQRDHLRSAIDHVGGSIIVDQVAVRPGHPMLLAVLPAGPLLVGLPGNPGAAVAGVLTLLRPVLAGLLGRVNAGRSSVAVATDVAGGPGHRLVPAIDLDGRAMPAPGRGPAMLTGWATATRAILIPPEGATTGTLVNTLKLPAWG